MRFFLFRNPILRMADDGGGGSLVELAEGGAAPAAPAAPAAGGEGGEPPAPAANTGESNAGDPPPKATRPDYVQEPFWDPEKGEVRVKELAQSHTDLRTKLSQRPGNPPETPEGYTLPPIEGMPDDLIPADDPVWKAVQQNAHKAGLSNQALQAIVQPYLSQAVKARTEGEAAAKAAQVAHATAELAKLGPNGRQMVQDAAARMRALEASGAISKDELNAFVRNSDAAGITLFTKLLGGLQPGIIPIEAVESGTTSQADAERMLREGMRKNDTGMQERARQKLRELDKAGQLRVG